MTVKDKVVIITGASSGIGAATAKLLAQNGAKVILAARRESRLQELKKEINATGGAADYQIVDVTKPHDLEKLVKFT